MTEGHLRLAFGKAFNLFLHMKIQIQVTQEDIDRGVRCTCENCPLALAMTRALAQDVVVVIGEYFFISEADKDAKPLPRVAEMFRSAFDAGFPVQPFEFELELEPPQSL
jgi:hypothetical protein